MARPKCGYDGDDPCGDQLPPYTTKDGEEIPARCRTMAECQYKRSPAEDKRFEPDKIGSWCCDTALDTPLFCYSPHISSQKDKRPEPEGGEKSCGTCEHLRKHILYKDGWKCVDCGASVIPDFPGTSTGGDYVPKRPSLPAGMEWVPETVKEWSEGMRSYPKPHAAGPREWMLRGGPAKLSHDLYWYCRPIQKDCEAEFQKWWDESGKWLVATDNIRIAEHGWRAAWAARGKE